MRAWYAANGIAGLREVAIVAALLPIELARDLRRSLSRYRAPR